MVTDVSERTAEPEKENTEYERVSGRATPDWSRMSEVAEAEKREVGEEEESVRGREKMVYVKEATDEREYSAWLGTVRVEEAFCKEEKERERRMRKREREERKQRERKEREEKRGRAKRRKENKN